MPFDEGNASVNGDASFFGPSAEYEEGMEDDAPDEGEDDA